VHEVGSGSRGAAQGCVLSFSVGAGRGVESGASSGWFEIDGEGDDGAAAEKAAEEADEEAAEETWCFLTSRGRSFPQAGELNKIKENKAVVVFREEYSSAALGWARPAGQET
jgi:hypothetical protein